MIYKVEAEQAGYVPIGRPIANTSVYVLDSNLQLVSSGAPGETLHRRRRTRAGVLGNAGADCRKVCAGSSRRKAGAHVFIGLAIWRAGGATVCSSFWAGSTIK